MKYGETSELLRGKEATDWHMRRTGVLLKGYFWGGLVEWGCERENRRNLSWSLTNKKWSMARGQVCVFSFPTMTASQWFSSFGRVCVCVHYNYFLTVFSTQKVVCSAKLGNVQQPMICFLRLVFNNDDCVAFFSLFPSLQHTQRVVCVFYVTPAWFTLPGALFVKSCALSCSRRDLGKESQQEKEETPKCNRLIPKSHDETWAGNGAFIFFLMMETDSS